MQSSGLYPEFDDQFPSIPISGSLALIRQRGSSAFIGRLLLNDLVLQGRDPQRPLSTIGFRDVHSSRRLRLVSAPVNLAVKILDAIFHPGFILPPSHAIHSGSGLTLQRVETFP
jgi:hypothetical protein